MGEGGGVKLRKSRHLNNSYVGEVNGAQSVLLSRR